MEPTLPTPYGSPEMGPPSLTPEQPARQGNEVYRAPEKQENTEQKAVGADTSAPPYAAPVPAPLQPVIPVQPQAPVPLPVTDDTPAVAGDDDVIEKEWVEKAKKVINETKHDPFLQERAVSRLQADYLQKRYGKTVKLPDEA